MSFQARPVILRKWSILSDLDGRGQVVLTFVIGNDGMPDWHLIIKVSPRSNPVHIVSAAIVGESERIDPLTLPYMVRDLAETKTREVFSQIRAAGRS